MSAEACGWRCRAMALVLPWLAGALFGAGLLVAGMTDPARVIAFLDVAGPWDPSLAFVMGGAVAVYAVAARWVLRRRDPWFDVRFHVPTRRDLDRRLVGGAAVFGIGWGLVGLCPGPAIVATASGEPAVLAFVAAMLAGMAAARALRTPARSARS